MKTLMSNQTITVQKMCYEAFDGKTFDNEMDCREYEAINAAPTILAADDVPHAIVSRDYVEACAMENDLVVVFFPRNFNDVIAIEAWATFCGVTFDIGKVKIDEPMLFDVGDYMYSHSYDDQSVKGIGEVYAYAGSVTEFKVSYCNAIDKMIEAAKGYAKVAQR